MNQPLQQFVKEILADKQNNLGKRCADDDALLYSIVCIRVGYGNKPLKELGELVAASKLPSPNSVMKARQKLQQADAALRGDAYEARHKTQPIAVTPQTVTIGDRLIELPPLPSQVRSTQLACLDRTG